MELTPYLSLGRLGKVTPAFAPTDIAGCQLFLKADTGRFQNSNGTTAATADGDPVGYWADQSGNNNHATMATGAARPTNKLSLQNGYGGVKFDGTDDYLATPINTGGQWHVFAVIKSPTATWNSYWGILDSDTNDNLHEWATMRPGNTNFWHPPVAVRKNGVDLPTQVCAPIDSAYFQLSIKMGTKTADIKNIGRMGAFKSNSYFLEVVAYSAYLSAGDLTALESYFNNKFAMY